ncbi:MAG: Ig-like domain-containing protein [Planctomycetes bacterium]|nr:Ig-like domain-containing protein [Planctomycetota bacterium]
MRMATRGRFAGFGVAVLAVLQVVTAGGMSCQPPMIIVQPPDVDVTVDFFVLTNRQKVIGLTGYFPGVEYDAVTFSILAPPANGQLIGTPPNVTYIPNAGFEGADSFTYRAEGGGQSRDRTVNLAVASTFVPPIGIPTPEFGITQSHMMYAGQNYDYNGTMAPYGDAGNGPFTHYVDFNTGSDAGNPFGTVAAPRRTIPDNLTPGSVVEIHGTDINYNSRINITGEGTLAKPIFIRGANAASKPLFRVGLKIECNFVICENLEYDARDWGTGTFGAGWIAVTASDAAPFKVYHHVAIRHSLGRDQPTNDNSTPFGVQVGHSNPSLNDATSLIENIVVYDVEVRNYSQWDNFTGSNDNAGVILASNSRHCWVLDCHLHHIRGDAVSVNRANPKSNQAAARNSYIGRNYLHNCKENIIDYKNGVTSVFSQNVCHTVRTSDSSTGAAITLHDDDPSAEWPGSDDVWILFNTLYDAEIAIAHENLNVFPIGKPSRSYLVGNVIFDVRNIRGNPLLTGVAIYKGQEAQSRIINNTIYNCDHGIWLGIPTLARPDACTQVVRNNIIYDLTERFKSQTGKDGMQVYIRTDAILPFTAQDHNLYFEDSGQVRFNITQPGLIEVPFNSVTDLVAATGVGNADVITDPKFVDPSVLDFHLTADSPARTTGVADDAYATFAAQFGLSIDVYQDGAARPAGRFDLGALGDAP